MCAAVTTAISAESIQSQCGYIKAVTAGDIPQLYTDFDGTTVDDSGNSVAIHHKAMEVLPNGAWKLIVGDPNGRELMRICVQAKAAMPDSQAPKPKQSRLRVGSIRIATTLIYLCLAVLGCGGFAAFFSHPARTVLAVASMLMGSAAFLSDANLSSGELEDRSNRWIFLPLLVIGLLSSFFASLYRAKGVVVAS
jgi:hypothetical protein